MLEEAMGIISALAKVAPAGDVLTILDDELGDGANKYALIPELFRESSDSVEALCLLMAKLEEPSSAAAMVGLVGRIDQAEDQTRFLEVILSAEISPSESQALATALTLDLLQSPNGEGRADELIDFAKKMDGAAARKLMGSLLDAVAAASPKTVWRIEADPDLSQLVAPGVLERAKESALGEMLSSNPLTTIQFLIESNGTNSDFERTGLYWANSNPIQFEKWLLESSHELLPEQKDTLTSGFAQKDAGSGSFSSAWGRIESISDPETKRKAEGRVWNAERDVVIQESRKDPQSLISKIISGESEHAPYWIETAMTEWNAKDSDAAWNWYQDNSRSLTPEQNEAVAMSYARLALKNGQADVAGQWAGQVVTPKFKAQIAAEIEKAGAAGN